MRRTAWWTAASSTSPSPPPCSRPAHAHARPPGTRACYPALARVRLGVGGDGMALQVVNMQALAQTAQKVMEQISPADLEQASSPPPMLVPPMHGV